MARIPGIDIAFAFVQARTGDSLLQLTGTAVGAAGAATRSVATAVGRATSAVAGTARGTTALVGEAREAVRTFHRLAVRADAIIAELEEPLLALAPGLRRLAVALDDPVVDDLPATLRQVQQDVLPVLRTLADTHERVAFIAGQTERIMTFVDDTGRSLAGLPGAALLGRRRTVPPRTITVQQVGDPRP